MREDKILIQKSGDLEKDQPLLGSPRKRQAIDIEKLVAYFF